MAGGEKTFAFLFAIRTVWMVNSVQLVLNNNQQEDHQQPVPDTGALEYCQSEYFNVSCQRNSVIVMESALYGRMRAGRCVTGNYGYLGCHADVIWYFNRKCSGYATCMIHTMDTTLHRTSPCPKDLATYLEAKHHCVSVANASRDLCKGQGYILLSQSSGYLSSIVSHEQGVGARDCPWRIQTLPGKKIRLILETFGDLNEGHNKVDSDAAAVNHVDICYEVGSVLEDLEVTPLKICRGIHTSENPSPLQHPHPLQGSQQTVVYLSESWNISIYFHSRDRQLLKDLNEFVLKYDAVGCPKVTASPPGGWMRMEGDRLAMGCHGNRQTWHLTCADSGLWLGPRPNCSSEASGVGLDLKASTIIQEVNGFPLGILVVVAIGVSVGVLFGGILLSLVSVFLKRNNRNLRSFTLSHVTPPSADVIHDPDLSVYEPGRHLPMTTTTTTTTSYPPPRHVIRCHYHGDEEKYSKSVLFPCNAGATTAAGAAPHTTTPGSEIQCHVEARADCRCELNRCAANTCELNRCDTSKGALLRL